MLPKKYSNTVFAVCMSLFMGTLMPFFITLIQFGFVENFFFRWGKASATAIPIALCIALFLVPHLRRLVDTVVCTK